MLIRVTKTADPIEPSEITPRTLFEQRRLFLRAAGLTGAGLALPALAATKLPAVQKSPFSTN